MCQSPTGRDTDSSGTAEPPQADPTVAAAVRRKVHAPAKMDLPRSPASAVSGSGYPYAIGCGEIDRPQPGQSIGSATRIPGGAWCFHRRRRRSDPGMSTYSGMVAGCHTGWLRAPGERLLGGDANGQDESDLGLDLPSACTLRQPAARFGPELRR